jgi:hypothetical protein
MKTLPVVVNTIEELIEVGCDFYWQPGKYMDATERPKPLNMEANWLNNRDSSAIISVTVAEFTEGEFAGAKLIARLDHRVHPLDMKTTHPNGNEEPFDAHEFYPYYPKSMLENAPKGVTDYAHEFGKRMVAQRLAQADETRVQ